jgi:hypothetical protein
MVHGQHVCLISPHVTLILGVILRTKSREETPNGKRAKGKHTKINFTRSSGRTFLG